MCLMHVMLLLPTLHTTHNTWMEGKMENQNGWAKCCVEAGGLQAFRYDTLRPCVCVDLDSKHTIK